MSASWEGCEHRGRMSPKVPSLAPSQNRCCMSFLWPCFLLESPKDTSQGPSLASWMHRKSTCRGGCSWGPPGPASPWVLSGVPCPRKPHSPAKSFLGAELITLIHSEAGICWGEIWGASETCPLPPTKSCPTWVPGILPLGVHSSMSGDQLPGAFWKLQTSLGRVRAESSCEWGKIKLRGSNGRCVCGIRVHKQRVSQAERSRMSGRQERRGNSS